MKQTCPSSDFVKLVMKKYNQECKSRKCCIWWLQVFIEDTHRATKRGELRESSVGLVVALLEHKEQAQLVHDKENTDKSSTTTDCNCSRNIITPPPPLCTGYMLLWSKVTLWLGAVPGLCAPTWVHISLKSFQFRKTIKCKNKIFENSSKLIIN